MSARDYTDPQLDAIGAGIKAGEPIEKVLAGLPAKPQRKKRRNEEYEIQRDVFTWWRSRALSFGIPSQLYFSIPNGTVLGIGSERYIRANMLKASGMLPGAPDTILCVPRDPWKALFIEYKTDRGTVPPEQTLIHSLLSARGYCVKVCRSTEEAIKEIENYLA